MPNQDLLNYIQKKLEKGSSTKEIKEILLNSGWKEELINESFILLGIDDSPKIETSPKPIEASPEIKTLLESIEASPETEESQKYEPFPAIKKEPFQPKPEFLKETPKHSRKRPIIIISIILLLIIGGIGFAYYYSKEPLLVLSRALDATEDIKSMETESELKITIDDVLYNALEPGGNNIPIEQEYNIKSNLAFDYSDINNIKIRETISLLNDNVNAELSFVNKVLYGKINNLNIDTAQYGYPIDQTIKDQFTNKWIKIIDSSENGLYSELENNVQEGETTKIETLTLIKNHPKIIKTIKRLPSEKISEVATNHYKIEIDKNEIANALAEYATSKTGEQAQAEEINALKENLNKYVSINNFEIWIGKKDNFVYKITLDVEISGLATEEEAGTAGSVRFQLTTSAFNQNKPLTISEPQETTSVEELMTALMVSQLQSSELNAKDASIKSNMDQLRSIAETYKTTNKQYSSKIINNTKCNSSLVKTFLETSTGKYVLCENIQSYSPGAFNIRINSLKDTAAKYCIQKVLNSGQTWCIDYTGYEGYEANCDSVNLDCKK